MASNLDATLKRGNGTDYDNVYLTTTWLQVENKPSTFTPTAHTHVLADITDAGAAAAKGVTDNSTATAISAGLTTVPTVRSIYYGLPFINGSHSYTSANYIYAPTTVGSAGQVAVSSGSGAPSYQYRDRSFFLAANFPNATTTLNPVTGMTFAMEAGKKYHVRFLGTYESATATTGCLLGVNLSAGTATVRGYAQGEITASEIASGLRKAIYTVTTTAGAAGSYITTTGMSAPGTYQALELDIVVQCATAGSIRILFASEVAGSTATLHAGSAMIVDELSV